MIKDSKYDSKIEFDTARAVLYSKEITHRGRLHIGRSHAHF